MLEEIGETYKIPMEPKFRLPGANVRDKMYELLENLFKDKKILEHGLEVGKQLAFVLSGGNTNINKELSEDNFYILSFWATWCVPCINELDALNEVYDELSDQLNFKVLAPVIAIPDLLTPGIKARIWNKPMKIIDFILRFVDIFLSIFV